jgi:hypothetical protein
MSNILVHEIHQVENLQEAELQQGVFVVLLDALKVPPHLLLIVSGKFFSISTLGASLDEEVEKYLQFIRRKKTATLFVKLAIPLIFTHEDLLKKVRKITQSYPKVDIGIATCLSPLRDFCSEVYETDESKISLIFDLLDRLKEQKVVEAYYQLNLDDELKNGTLSLNKYSVFEVNEAIHSAKKSKF